VANPLDHDVWVRAVEVLPGDRSVVHHVLAGLDDPVDRGKRTAVEQLAQFGGYAPGKNALVYPPETGVLLRKEARLRFQMHYTPSGRATTDVTRVGYYFAARPPRHPLRLVMLANYSLVVPPNTKAYTETVEHVFERDVVLHSLMPHAHLRGKASKFTALSGRTRGGAAVGAEVRLQLADALSAQGTQAPACRQQGDLRYDLGQLHTEPGQPRPESRGALGGADLGRDERRVDPLSVRR
jgi:hypothetical protein